VPRALRVDDRHRSLLATPAIKPTDTGALDGRVYTSEPDHALLASAKGHAQVAIDSASGSGATVEVDVDRALLTVERTVPADGALTERFEAPLDPAQSVTTVVIVDHGTLEVFAAGGSTTISLLTFPGPDWTVRVDGDAALTRL
jgi:sucrose-6-phosphate hydrolase SacC (GH32 family)